MNKNDHACSIVVVPRDKFSTTESCLETLLNITTEWNEVSEFILVLGGAPKKVCDRLKGRFGGKVRFIIEDRFLNPSESRNIGLRTCRTPLDRKSTRLNSSHSAKSRMPSSA